MMSMPDEFALSRAADLRTDAAVTGRRRRLLAARRAERKAELTARRARAARDAVW